MVEKLSAWLDSIAAALTEYGSARGLTIEAIRRKADDARALEAEVERLRDGIDAVAERIYDEQATGQLAIIWLQELLAVQGVMDDKKRGLYGKFHIERTDGRSAPGEKHNGCDYFVLDLTHDPLALPAIEAYETAAAAAGYTQLAEDLRLKRAMRKGNR